MSCELLIDSGNTRIKWALSALPHAGQFGWLASGSCARDDVGSLPKTWRDAVRRLAGEVGGNGEPKLPVAAWISNVAGPQSETTLRRCVTALGVAETRVHVIRSRARQCGLSNLYPQPAQLGSDRWAAAIYARHAYLERPLLVATLGTATTLDRINPEGEFLGGLILPGLLAMLGSLGQSTAGLPDLRAVLDGGAQDKDTQPRAAEDGLPCSLFGAPREGGAAVQTRGAGMLANALRAARSGHGGHTQAAILGGCVLAQAGAVQRAWDALLEEHELGTLAPGGAHALRLRHLVDVPQGPLCVLAGGAASAVEGLLDMPLARHDNLVLSGLRLIAQEHGG
ncbi:MAG: type III pantothenate kinase [Candidatus Protistobacter heckmanni]|nr:type III pantothenate kinase [Candidatus Protistobacter heckmanni]